MYPQCLPTSFSLIRLTVREQMWFQAFQAGHHGGHLRSWNETNLAILNFHVTPMPPTKFRFNPTYRSGAEVVEDSHDGHSGSHRILEQNDFSNSESV